MKTILSSTLSRWRMTRCFMILSIILISSCINFIVVESSECPESFIQSANCSCSLLGLNKYDLLCPLLTYSAVPSSHYDSYVLQALIEINKKALISCSEVKSPEDLNVVSGLNVGPVGIFAMSVCPLPDKSLKEFMKSMGITSAKTLQIQTVSNLKVLDEQYLEGLDEVTRMDVSRTGLSEFSKDVFKDLINLISLSMMSNNINYVPKEIFKYLSKLRMLDLGSNNITYLETGVFYNLSDLRILNLYNNKINNLTRSVFLDTPNLESLDLHENSLVSLPADIFNDLRNLTSINMFGNEFSTLPAELLSSLPSLEVFILMNNKSPSLALPAGFFSNLKHLKEVNLNACNLLTVPNDLIWNSSNLTKIHLQNNSLYELAADFFKDNKRLNFIDLSYNKLTTLPDSIFLATSKLRTLIMHHNQLTHISRELLSNLRELEELDLRYNRLVEIHMEAFFGNGNLQNAYFSYNFLTLYDPQYPLNSRNELGPTSPFKPCRSLSKLFLANNSISQMFEDFLFFPNLTVLDLSYNKFSYLEARDLHFLSSKQPRVYLSYNNISIVDISLMETLAISQYHNGETPLFYENKYSTQISLTGNPLQCDCTNFYLLQYFEGVLTPEVNYIIDIKSKDLKCAGPEHFRGLALTDVPSKVLSCSLVNPSCPEKCKCYLRPADHGLIINCHRLNLMTLPKNFLLKTSAFYQRSVVLNSLNRPWMLEHDVFPYFSLVNHTELDMSGNNITSLPKDLFNNFINVTKINLSSNNLTYIDLAKFPPNITELLLDDNKISNMDSDSVRYLNESKKLRVVSLTNNPWQCDCNIKDLLSFIQNNFEKVPSSQNMICLNGKPLIELTVNDICPVPLRAILITSILIAFLGLITGLLVALFYRYNQEIKVWLYAHKMFLWFVTEDELDRNKIYDAFISYAHQDEEFVIKHLVPGLEDGAGKFKLCLHYRDWIVGDYIPNQIVRSVENSRRTVVVLSPNFVDSVWGKMEFRTAHTTALKEGRARVIMIIKDDIGPTNNLDPELKAYISMNTYIKWGDPWFWDRLRYALPHHHKASKRVSFFKKNLARQQNRPALCIDKDDLIKGNDPNVTPPATTTPPANSFTHQIPSFIPSGLSISESANNAVDIKF